MVCEDLKKSWSNFQCLVFRMYLVPNDLRSTTIPAFDNVSKGERYPGLGVYIDFAGYAVPVVLSGSTGNSTCAPVTSNPPSPPKKKTYLKQFKQRVRKDVISAMIGVSKFICCVLWSLALGHFS